MNRLSHFGMGALIFLAASCSNSSDKSKSDDTQKASNTETCQLSYDPAQTTLSWTAYKFTEAVGVNGRFDQITINGNGVGESVEAVIKNASFAIPISGINTGLPERDEKIKKFFFGTLDNSDTLTGKIVEVQSQKIVMDFKLNNLVNRLEADIEMSGDTLIIKGIVNVDNWNAQSGIQKLNKECELLHTGPDGKSYLWPEVALNLKTVLKKVCP